MASTHKLFSPHIPTLIILVILFKTGNCCFTRIFCFGDSTSDTGNYLRSIGSSYNPIRNLPNGETYFGHPTGRFSDGRIILDFIAKAYNLPYIPPYLAGKSAEDFPHGTNFAVAGATALNNSFLESMGIEGLWTNYSLGIQLDWFKNLLSSILQEPGNNNDFMSSTLFVVGEIGGNDYNYPLLNGSTINEVQIFVPDVIRMISLTLHELIGHGAKRLLVPNNFPIGCLPAYLTLWSQKKEEYDSETGCLKRLNEFSQYHNAKLLEELEKIRLLYPDVTIIYADYYEALMSIFRNPKNLGFSYPLIACCGSNGPYNYSELTSCGDRSSTVCSDPSKYISWDGVHLTEAAYKIIAHGVLQGRYSSPSIPTTCSNLLPPRAIQ